MYDTLFSELADYEPKMELIYPLSSLVAEFGGILGLFIGFSFMALWDGLMYVNMLRQSFMKAAM